MVSMMVDKQLREERDASFHGPSCFRTLLISRRAMIKPPFKRNKFENNNKAESTLQDLLLPPGSRLAPEFKSDVEVKKS
jgi:hypothetical protein